MRAHRRFPQELNVGHVSSSVMWEQLCMDVRATLEEHVERSMPNQSSDYMNLHFRIKWLYNKYVSDIPPFKGTRSNSIGTCVLK